MTYAQGASQTEPTDSFFTISLAQNYYFGIWSSLNMDLPKFHTLKIFLRIILLIKKPVCEKIWEKNKIQMITETKIKWVQISFWQTQRKWLLASLPCFFPLTFPKITERWLSKPSWKATLFFNVMFFLNNRRKHMWWLLSSRVWLGHRVSYGTGVLYMLAQSGAWTLARVLKSLLQ